MRANFIHIQEQAMDVINRSVEGSFAEFGVWHGTTFLPLAELARINGRDIHAVDSFRGMAPETPKDGDRFRKGTLSVGGSGTFRMLTQPFRNVTIHEGFIPEILTELTGETFAFVHLDVDQYQPTLDALRFLWPKLSEGGCVIIHDWFPDESILASQAIKEFSDEIGRPITGEQLWSHHCWFVK